MKNEKNYLDIILCAFNAALRLQPLDYPKLIKTTHQRMFNIMYDYLSKICTI